MKKYKTSRLERKRQIISLYRWYEHICRNHEDTKTLLEKINKSSNVARHKISTHKKLFLYINNENTEKKFKKTDSFIIVPKRIKYLEIKLTKKIKNLHNDYKILLKEIKEVINKDILSIDSKA